MTKQRLFLAALVLFMGAISAHAQTGYFCYFQPQGNTDQTLSFGESGPTFGYKAYSCPIPPTYASFVSTRYWFWTSTCPQGGIIIQGVTIDSYDQFIQVDSSIFDPLTGRKLGVENGFAYVAIVGNLPLPQYVPTASAGYKCNGSTRDNVYQSTATATQ